MENLWQAIRERDPSVVTESVVSLDVDHVAAMSPSAAARTMVGGDGQISEGLSFVMTRAPAPDSEIGKLQLAVFAHVRETQKSCASEFPWQRVSVLAANRKLLELHGQAVPMDDLRRLFFGDGKPVGESWGIAIYRIDMMVASYMGQILGSNINSQLLPAIVGVMRETQSVLVAGATACRIERSDFARIRLLRREEMAMVVHRLDLHPDMAVKLRRGE